jgi:hypothetical protein
MKIHSQGTIAPRSRAREGGAAVSWIPAAPFQHAEAADWLAFLALAAFVATILIIAP